jgi:hypothetical protein
VNQYVSAISIDQLRSSSRVISCLLDTIHALQRQVDALGEILKQDTHGTKSAEDTTKLQGYKVLYRVFCDKTGHCHNRTIYKDEPKFGNDFGWGYNEVLGGNRPVFNVETYFAQYNNIHFVIFKEYNYTENQSFLYSQDKKLRENTNSISPRRERIWITLRALHYAITEAAKCEQYNRMPLEANMKEIDTPYNFLFHYNEKLLGLLRKAMESNITLTPLLNFLE